MTSHLNGRSTWLLLFRFSVFLGLTQAWEAVESMEILPLEEEDLSRGIQDMSCDRSERFDIKVTTRGAEILAAVLDVLSRLRKLVREEYRGQTDVSISRRLEKFDIAGRTLITFAGMMHYDRAEITASVLGLGLSMFP